MPGRRRRGLGRAQYAGLLRADFASFAQHAFSELYPRTPFQMNWHLWVIAARLAAVRAGQIRRLAIYLPPRTGWPSRSLRDKSDAKKSPLFQDVAVWLVS
jgi:hypothetical protein